MKTEEEKIAIIRKVCKYKDDETVCINDDITVSEVFEIIDIVASQQSDRRKELIRYADCLTLKGWSDFAIDEEILDDYIESHPEPAKVEQQIKEKGE